ncbi:MAG: putative bifunctional diguanylate cyclase/phosphodiesterase, partial [Actinomycetota bacterium]
MDLQPIRILLVEDNPGDARLFREYLAEEGSASFHIGQVDRLQSAMGMLAADSYDVMLLDLSLPDSHGLNTVRSVHAAAPNLPIVVLTGHDDETQAVRSVQEGAQDYLVKGRVDGNLLARSMRYAIERHRMLTELAQARKVEHYIATHDVLTDLPNRQLFQDRLDHALAEARRNRHRVALLFLDLDRFKLTNDTLGHAAGDRLLQSVAERLGGCIRSTDTAARLGGDEFTVIVPAVQRTQDVARVANKILDALSRPFVQDGIELFITTSIGISIFPSDGVDSETLVKNADIAMYRAKANGRNNFQFYTPAMNAKALERMELEYSLRQALDRGEFVLHYQPQVDVSNGRIIGMEALLRWKHPTLGMLMPSEFIPLAEETGLIVPIGEWVLRTACTQARHWLDRGLPEVSMAVNFSARQFQRQNPVKTVTRVLNETGLEPRFLELELTESVVMRDAEAASATLRQLKQLGIHLSLDDFGTGYSSLAHLKRFPLEKLKIDKLFVHSLNEDKSDRAITSAIIAMAHSLQLMPVAEGVETLAQLEALRTLACDKMQGFLFSGAVTAAAAARLLDSQTAWRCPGVAVGRGRGERVTHALTQDRTAIPVVDLAALSVRESLLPPKGADSVGLASPI